jgi:hypothetical protein
MNVTILLFDGLTALDAVGPYEVLWRVPGASLEFVAAETGIKRTDNGGLLGLLATRPLAEVGATDVLVVPGGLVRVPSCRMPPSLIGFGPFTGRRRGQRRYAPVRSCSARRACSTACRRRPIGPP